MRISNNAKIAATLSVFAIAATTYFAFMRSAPTPSLDEGAARALVVAQWGDCTGVECTELTVEVSSDRVEPVVVAIYSGLLDDSVEALRITARATHDLGTDDWSLQETAREWRCRQGRGHQEWSTELCV